MSLQRIAMISVHTSPIAPMGGKKTGGMNVYIRELAQEMGRRGIAVDIFTRRSTFEEPDISDITDNVRVIYLEAGPLQPLTPEDHYPHLQKFTMGVIKFATLNCLQYDLVYSHYWLSGWVANKLKETWGTPFVQMFHTLGKMKDRLAPSTPSMIFNQRINTESQLVQQADCLIAATEAEQIQLIWLYRADPRRIRIIPPGVNTERFRPQPMSEARQRLGLPAHAQVLLFVGRIEPLKGVDTILESLKLLRDRSPHLLQNLLCIILGGSPEDEHDPEMHRLQQIVRQSGLREVVQFVGAKEQPRLAHYYAAANAVLMPSDYESFGMVALEAMASGTPVIASAVGGLAFLVRDQETGYHIPNREPQALAERICWVVTDTDKTRQMGQQAALIASDYAWQNIAERLLPVFEGLRVGKRPVRPTTSDQPPYELGTSAIMGAM